MLIDPFPFDFQLGAKCRCVKPLSGLSCPRSSPSRDIQFSNNVLQYNALWLLAVKSRSGQQMRRFKDLDQLRPLKRKKIKDYKGYKKTTQKDRPHLPEA